MGCGCACLEGKDHCGRLDMDCICPAKNETGQKPLLLAKKLKVKYSNEKALAHRKSINQTGFGPKASCVGDDALENMATKLYKVGMIQA